MSRFVSGTVIDSNVFWFDLSVPTVWEQWYRLRTSVKRLAIERAAAALAADGVPRHAPGATSHMLALQPENIAESSPLAGLRAPSPDCQKKIKKRLI